MNPFLVNIPDKEEYTRADYIEIQKQLNDKKQSIEQLTESMYPPKNKFYELDDFKMRVCRGITQTIIVDEQLPEKTLYKIGDGGNGKNCIVCTTAFSNKINGGNTRLNASKRIKKSLKEVGFNGYFYLLNGGFPNPTGTEMKYIGVPYCFKIFLMLEAQKLGFERVIWIDSGCYAINNPQDLFEVLYKQDVLIKTINGGNNYDAMVFQNTISLLNQITGTDIHNAYYIESVVFGFNMTSSIIQKFIKDYYEMVKLGYPFFSIFPEEIVFTSLFNKPEYKILLETNLGKHVAQKTRIHENIMDETTAKSAGFYFHHKDYSKYKTDI